MPKNYLWAQIEFLDILTGAAKAGDQLDVFIANTPAALRHITPTITAMNARTYFVAVFLNEENEHQLLGLPASQAEFEKWEAELMEDLDKRGLLGPHH